MNFFKHHQSIFGTALSLLFVLTFFIWSELDPNSLQKIAKEDGPIENLSAVFFGLSSICFIVVACRSDFLKRKDGLKYLMTISWALLMFVFMGEEISWGQRIFNIATPEILEEVNKQNEITIHNIEFVDSFLGGKYRYLSIMMFITGLLLPIYALTQYGKKLIQKLAFPVSPLCYAPLFLGAYAYGKYYHSIMGNDAIEVREFLMSLGMLGFALNGAISPDMLFRTSRPEKTSQEDSQ